mgnify:CR=1 FL=1
MDQKNIKKIVLAYSGGLDTSIIIPWLKEHYNNPEIIAVSGDVGQNDELEGWRRRPSRPAPASCTSQTSPTRWWTRSSSLPEDGASYEQYLLGTAFARPIIAKKLVEIAKAEAPTPSPTAAPARATTRCGLSWPSSGSPRICPSSPPGGSGTSKGRDEEIDYAEAHNVPLKISRETNYSKDKNLWHLSHEGLDLEDPANEPQYEKPGFLEMSVSPIAAPDKPPT